MADTAEPELRPADEEYGKPERCPHCRTVTGVEPAGAGRLRCRMCGGPRVVVDDARVARSGREVPALRTAHRERFRVAAFRLGAALGVGVGAVSLLMASLVLWLASPGVLGTALLLVLCAAPLVAGLLGWRQASRHARQRDAALDTAWCLVAEDILEQRGEELDARELARMLHLEESEADRVLALLQSHDSVRTRVTDAGDLVYSSSGAALQLRVDPGGEVEAETIGEPSAAPRAQRES
jgi:hypothetical protein